MDGQDPTAIFADAEERERATRDPDGFWTVERLHDAFEDLADALDQQLQETAMRLFPPLGRRRSEELLEGARTRADLAVDAWRDAISRADSLLAAREGDLHGAPGRGRARYREVGRALNELALLLEHDDPLRDACRDLAAGLRLRAAASHRGDPGKS